MQPVETQGPFTDGGGSYYLDVFADGTSEKRYVTTPARPQQSGLAAGTSSIDDAGNLVAPSAPVSQGPAVPAAGQLDAGTINEVTETADTGGGGSAPRSGSSRRSSYGGGSGYQSGGGYDDGGGLPAYQNGQFHPSDPRFIPNEMPLGDRIAGAVAGPLQGLGAQIAQAAGAVPRGEDYQRPTISSDAGWAGPSGAGVFGGASVSGGQPRSASNPLEGWNGPNSTSGGGGNTSPQYDALRAKGDAMRGKIKGMAANIRGGRGGSTSSSTSSSTTGPSTTQQYRQQGRRMDRANERYNEAIYNPDPLPVHGFAKRQGWKPGTVEMFLGDPSGIAPAAIPGFQAGFNPTSEEITRLPMTDLALILGGTQRRNGLTTKTPVVKPPAILRKQGVKPVKPENKRVLDPSAVVNKVASMYQQVGQGQRAPWMDSETLLGNLATAKKKSILRQNLTTQFEEDPNAALNSVRSYVTSALSTTPMNAWGRSRMQSVDNTITNMAPQLARMKPKKASKMVSTIANQYRSGAW